MKFLLSLFFLSVFTYSFASNEIYWELPPYSQREVPKQRYVYHLRRANFQGNLILPLNRMREMEGFETVYQVAVSKYEGREWLLERMIPSLNCLWNDVIFLSPVHPNKHYKEYQKLGYIHVNPQFFKIPVEVLEEKRVSIWKWLSHKKYSWTDPIHDTLESYCEFDFGRYQEMDDLPDTTKKFYAEAYDPDHPDRYPKFGWFEVPHILCQDPIDITDPRITIINFEDEE